VQKSRLRRLSQAGFGKGILFILAEASIGINDQQQQNRRGSGQVVIQLIKDQGWV
jgi:hypothetical protein